MDKLYALKTVVVSAYTLLSEDQRGELIVHMGELFRRPLIRFDEGYDEFIGQITKKSDTYDRWLNLQMQVLTEVGNEPEAFKQLIDTFNAVLSGTPGGETATFDKELFDSYSFVIALAFRIYLDALVFKQAESGGQQ